MDIRAESQAKLLQDHITLVEDNFSSLLQNFAAIARKSGKLRDKGDLLVKSLSDYSDQETPSVKSSLAGCAECFAAIEDYREAKVLAVQTAVKARQYEFTVLLDLGYETGNEGHSASD